MEILYEVIFCILCAVPGAVAQFSLFVFCACEWGIGN